MTFLSWSEDGRDTEKGPLLKPLAAPLVRFIQDNPASEWIQRMYGRKSLNEKPPRRG